LVAKCPFHRNLVKEYALMKEMPCRPLNMESFGQKIFILSQLYLTFMVGLLNFSRITLESASEPPTKKTPVCIQYANTHECFTQDGISNIVY